MPIRPMNRLVDHLRRAAVRSAGEPLTDGELLERFVNERDGLAFEVLLRRHAPMVLGVCRRVIGNVHDAEDAFQATFLVLVRKAARVRPRDAVGNWLYGVAYRTALRARTRLVRRRFRERLMPAVPAPLVEPEAPGHDLRPLLDGELNALPDKYRLPVVLCDLEGRGRKEAARQLHIPEGTLSSRLATARKLLAVRLSRRGVTLSAGALTAALAQNSASACVPGLLLFSTTKAALCVAAGPAVAAGMVPGPVTALTEGVLRMMFLAKLKMTALTVVGVAALGLGTGGFLYQVQAGTQDAAAGHATSQQLVRQDRERQPEQAERDGRARKREAELRRQLEDARIQAERATREAVVARERAEAERQRAEAIAHKLEVRLKEALEAQASAKRDALQQRAANSSVPTVERAWDKKRGQIVGGENQALLAKLKAAEADLMVKFEHERRDLQERLSRLDAEQKQQLAALHADFQKFMADGAGNARRTANSELVQYAFACKAGQAQASAQVLKKLLGDPHTWSISTDERGNTIFVAGPQDKMAKVKDLMKKLATQSQEERSVHGADKLDRILERLDQMERRLRRLEQRPLEEGERTKY